ncbi:MAG: 30S ribosomal protein S1 [Pseudomonadota bacterium]
MNENFAELLEQSFANEILRPGTIIRGTVIRIDKDYVIVNAGLKSEGIIPREQFENAKGELEVNVGDEVDVALDMIEDGYGETRLSRDKAKRAESWRELQELYDTETNVNGYVTTRVKGGFMVEVMGLKGFLPGSLADVRPIRDPGEFEHKEFELKIIKMDSKRNNIVLSRRAVLEASISEERSNLLENLKEGDEVEGTVKNLTDYGAFIDLGGIDGLLHITDMSWRRIKHPSDIIDKDQKIKVSVLKIDRDKNRVSLGIKQLTGDPWKGVKESYPVGSRVKGRVTNVTDYGCFIELKEGIEGLVHMSEMDWSNKNAQPSKLVSLDQELEVMVLEVDEDRHRISLGIKQCSENPWTQFADSHKKGEKLNGVVKSITDFGVFIGLEGSIDGLIHRSDVAWDLAEADKKMRQLKKNEEIEVVILAIEAEQERISLGIKQLHQDPFTDYTQAHDKGSLVKGKITAVESKVLKIDLEDNIHATMRAEDVSSKKVSDLSKQFAVGNEIEAKIVGFDYRNREVQLSIKAIEQADAKILKEISKNASAAGKATLGDLLQAKEEEKQN